MAEHSSEEAAPVQLVLVQGGRDASRATLSPVRQEQQPAVSMVM
jgi:hypothetical protein